MATKTQKAVVDLIVEGKSAQMSVKDLGSALHEVTKELRAMAEADDPARYAKLLKEKQKISDEYTKQKVAIGDLKSEWQKFVDEFKTVAIGVVGGNLLTAAIENAINFLPEQIDKLIKKKDELADVAKTTNMTDQQVRALRSNLKELDTRTTLSDLMSLAEVGGQFGVAKREIDGFVKVSDMANVAIGKAFGSAAQTGEQLFKMNNVLKDIEGNTVGDRMLFISNALNVLESQGAATANGIADYTNRMAGFLGTLGVASKDIIGIAAMLEETGTTAERGSTGVVNVYRAMLSETETFAKVAGVPLKEYQDIIQKDMTEALKLYVQGLQKVQSNQLLYNETLQQSKLNGMGEAEVISKMVGNYDLMIDKIQVTGEALKQTGSITDEFAKKNFAMAVELKRIKQYINELFLIDSIEQYISAGMHAVAEFIPVLRTLAKWLGEQRTLWQVLGTALLVYYGNIIKTTLVTVANTTATLAQKAAYQLGYYWLVVSETATKAYALAQAVLTGQITLATAATRIWNAVLNANPLGVVITLLSAFVGALRLYSDNTKEAIALERKKRDLMVLLKETTDENTKAQQYLNDRVNEYTNLSKDEQESLKKEILLRKEKLAAQLKNIEAQRMELSQMAANPSVWQKFTGMLTAGGNPLAFAQQMAAKAADNITAVNAQFELEIQNLKDGLGSYDETLKRIDRLSKSATSTTVVTAGSGTAISAGKSTQAKADKTPLPQVEKGKASDYEVKPVADVFEEPDMTGALKEALVPLEGEHAGKQHDIRMREIQGQISPEQANLEKLAAEEQYLMARLMLEQTYNESTIQTQQQLNDNLMAQQEERAMQDVEQKQMMILAEYELSQARKEALLEGVSTLKSFFGETTLVYKALFVAEKAMAIADVIINSQKALSRVSAVASAIPPPFGPTYLAVQTGIIKAQTTKSLITIGGQTLQGLIPKKAQGGYTDVRSLAEGFVDRATLYSMPNRNYIAGEAGREFILSNAALQQPAIANFASMMDAIQKSKNYGLLGGLDRAPTPGPTQNDTAILNELTRLNTNMAALAQRPIRFSHDKFRDFEDFMDQVFEETRV